MDELFKYTSALARIHAESCSSIGLLPESGYNGRYPDPAFDMPSVADTGCPCCCEDCAEGIGIRDYRRAVEFCDSHACECDCHEGGRG